MYENFNEESNTTVECSNSIIDETITNSQETIKEEPVNCAQEIPKEESVRYAQGTPKEEPGNYVWEAPKEEPKKEKKSGGFMRKVLVAACCGLCFGLFAGLGLFAVNQVTTLTKNNQEEVYHTTGNDTVINKVEEPKEKDDQVVIANTSTVEVVTSDYSDVVERVMPAMVSIVNTYVEEMNYWGQTFTQEGQSGGSGIIIAENDTELLIATNNHVVDEAKKLEVTFIDGNVVEAQIKGKDADMDLAVIAIPLDTLSDETKSAIAIAEMGDSDALRLGEPVIAIGNALGYGQSVTGGYISALNREIDLSDGSKGTFIQTDAAINHGNSGGALLNVEGKVVGINSNKISGSSVEGMGYAIPISAAEPIIGDLMTKETKHKVTDGKVGYIGIENPMTVPEDMVRYYNFPEGVFIRNVAENSPAEDAGILNNDIIVEFAGEKITTFEDLQEELEYHGPGSRVDIVVMRQVQGKYVEIEISMVLGTRPDDQ